MRTRPDLIDNELLGFLSRAGCTKIHYGIESGNQKILNKIYPYRWESRLKK